MNKSELQKALSDLPMGGLRFFESVGSTNDEALAWAAQGAPDLSMVIADEQTAGRGRSGRKWFTPPGTALAFSLILYPSSAEQTHPARTAGLGALALVESLRKHDLAAQIKWPNDVLIAGSKVAGILVESVWTGETLEAAILGVGLNVLKASRPPAEQLLYPATSLEDALGHSLERAGLLHEILAALLAWRPRLGTDEFLQAWEEALAFRGETVQVWAGDEAPLTGELLGLEADGGLRLRGTDRSPRTVQFGEIHLRPAM